MGDFVSLTSGYKFSPKIYLSRFTQIHAFFTVFFRISHRHLYQVNDIFYLTPTSKQLSQIPVQNPRFKYKPILRLFISLYIFTHKKQIHHLVWFIRFFQSQNLRLYYPWGDKKEYLDHTHTHAHTIKWTTLWVQHPLSLFGLMILSLSWSHIKHMPLMDGWMDGKIDRCFFVCVDVYFCVFLCRSVYWIIAWSRWALLRVSQQRLAPAEPSAPVTWPYLWTCYSTASLMITHLPPTW